MKAYPFEITRDYKTIIAGAFLADSYKEACRMIKVVHFHSGTIHIRKKPISAEEHKNMYSEAVIV